MASDANMSPDKPRQRKHPRRPMLSCNSYSCNKLWLFIYCVAFLIMGIVLLAIGIYVEVHRQRVQAVNNKLALPVALIILVGLIITINSLCGLVGTIKESPALLKGFLCVTVGAFLLQVILGIVAFVFREELPEIVSRHLMFAVSGYTGDEGLRSAMDYIQSRLKCCGFDSYEDWNYENDDYACGPKGKPGLACGVPASCCKQKWKETNPDNCGAYANSTVYGRIYTDGCTTAFLTLLAANMDLVGAAGLGCAIPQIIGMLLAYFFLRRVQDFRVWYRVENYRA